MTPSSGRPTHSWRGVVVAPRRETCPMNKPPAPDVADILSEHIPIPDMIDQSLILCLICFDDAYDGAQVDFLWPCGPVRRAIQDPRLTAETLAWLARLGDPGIARLVRRHPNCPDTLRGEIVEQSQPGY